MREILLITNCLGDKSGYGRYSLDLVNQLIKNNFSIVVICHKKNYKYKNIKQLEILPSSLSFKKNYFLTLLYVLKNIKQLKKIGNFSFIHCLVEPYAFFTFLLSRVLKIRYFLTIHGSYGIKCFYNKIYKFLQLLSYRKAVKIICVSNYTKSRILKYIKLNNIEVIPNGVNEDFLNSNSPVNIDKKNIIIGVGALKRRKGFDIALRSVALVKEKIPDIEYYVVGSQKDKQYFKYLKDIINNNNLQKNVIFFENISDDDLVKMYLKSKIFILTPISDKYNFEGFGLVYLEANALGLPVVGSYKNGGEDAIKDGFSGFLTIPNDENDVAEKILKLLNDDNYDRMSKRSIEWAKKHSWKNIIKKYINVYCERN